jgi:hypothetical protein
VLLSIGALACGACAPDEPDEEAPEAASAVIVDNGTSLNGTSLNGTSLNGTSLNGTSLNGASLNGASLSGASLSGTSLKGTVLGGTLPDGKAVGDTDLVGALMTGVCSHGGEVTLRIDDIDASEDPEIHLYAVSYDNGSQWQSICGYDGEGAPIRAIPLSGTWDHSAGTPTGGDHIEDQALITFACLGSTLAKCTLLGYEPWMYAGECRQGSCHALPLRALHQACVRMMRADYCGDGQAHTIGHVPVNVWDGLEIQLRSEVSDDWKLEAEWTPEGAACIKDLRYDPGSATSEYVRARCEHRLSADFSCFGDNSTFHTNYGYDTPLPSRSLLRMEFDYSYVDEAAGDD